MKTGQKWPVTAVTDVDLKKKKKKPLEAKG